MLPFKDAFPPPMTSFGRQEIGALGYMRQPGPQRGNFKGINGRAQQGDLGRNPNHAMQKVSAKPWAGMLAPKGGPLEELGAASASASNISQLAAGAAHIGNFLFPGGDSMLALPKPSPQGRFPGPPQKKAFAAAGPAQAAAAPHESTLPMQARDETMEAVKTNVPAEDASQELKEELLACTSRLDAMALRLTNSETLLKDLSVALSSLRQEYNQISQQTDGQTTGRLEACERLSARLEDSFADFSTKLQRQLKDTEAMAAATAAASQEIQAPLLCTALEPAEGIKVLDQLLLYPPLHLNATQDVCLFRRSLDVYSGSVRSSDFVIQARDGEPCVLVH